MLNLIVEAKYRTRCVYSEKVDATGINRVIVHLRADLSCGHSTQQHSMPQIKVRRENRRYAERRAGAARRCAARGIRGTRPQHSTKAWSQG
ncbi:hypothetical protein ON010_g7820 [Phytophthora cinnamomi]|nr:hypothetical protein ON010_g7820 [Phytophthora cinnamomi]